MHPSLQLLSIPPCASNHPLPPPSSLQPPPPTPSPLPQTEVETGYLQSQANQYGYVLAACDWWGMAELDEPAVVYMLAMDIGDFGIIPERLTQGMVNALLLMKMLKVRCVQCSRLAGSRKPFCSTWFE